MYSFSGNSEPSAPMSTFMCLRAIYIVPGSVYIFPPAEQADRSGNIYMNHSQTHWDKDPDIPFLGIFVSKFRYFVFVVCQPDKAFFAIPITIHDYIFFIILYFTFYSCTSAFILWDTNYTKTELYTSLYQGFYTHVSYVISFTHESYF